MRNSTFCTSYHLINYQREVWSLINKFESFNIKFIPHIENSNTNMLINEASNLNICDGSIDKKFSIETCRPLIPSTNWRNSNNDQHILEHLLSDTSKGSIIIEEQHESLLQAPVSNKKPKLRDLLSSYTIILESHFGLQDTFKMKMNGFSQRTLRKIYSSLKLVVKMKPDKFLAAQIIISIHARRGQAVKLKFARYQLDDDILLKRKFGSHLWKQCIQAYTTCCSQGTRHSSREEAHTQPSQE
jgi:hypothetical protein